MEDQTRKISLGVPIAIVLAGLLIAGSIYYTRSNNAPAKMLENKDVTISPIGEGDYILGNPSSEIILVEYSDTECPYCKKFHQVLKMVMADYAKDGKVAWVYRHYPIEQLHSRAPKESEAVECAGELGGKAKFWDYLSKLYEATPSNNGLDPKELPVIAGQLGIDKKSFESCLTSGKYTSKVSNSVQDALKAGGSGTPYTVIITKNGEKMPLTGFYGYEQLKSLIDGLLKSK